MRRLPLLRMAVLLPLLAGVGSAAARSLSIERLDAEIGVNVNGSIVVTEKIQLNFVGVWNGIYRDIPVEYRTPQGFNYRLLLKGIEVTDEDGRPLKHEMSRQRHYQEIKIWIPGARDAVRTIVLRYRVTNGLRFFQDHDELYWNVTGDEWEMPIESATARIVLPERATGLRALAFTGSYGSKSQDADVRMEENAIRVAMKRPLAFREGLTVVIGWDKGFVQEPGMADKIADFLRSNLPLVIPVLVFPLMLGLWYKQGRDPRLRPITVQYEPPDGLTVAEVGTLVDNSADMKDITATIVDLAVRGFVTIEEGEEEHFLGLTSSKSYTFRLRKPAAQWVGLKDHEVAMLSSLFDGGNVSNIDLAGLRNKFYKHIPAIRDSIFAGLMGRRYYLHRPDRVKAAYVVAGGIAGFIIGWGGLTLGDAWGVAPTAAILAGILTGLIIVGFGWFMPARTVQGSRALEGVLGFEEFLRRVEKDRFERVEMTPALFEKFLPYAMALGVENHWANAFDGIYKEAPQWYRGTMPGTMFHPALFAASMGRMAAHTGSVMTSAPRSARGSGFGGGGFSGGGFGGGGGRGF